MKKILLTCHDIPSLSVGATLPFYHLIKNIGNKYDLHLISFDSGKYSTDDLKDKIRNIDTIPIPEYLDTKNQLTYTLKNMISTDNIHTRSFLNYYYHKDMSKLIKKNCADADIIITDMPMAFYTKNINKKKIVYAFDAVSNYNHKMYEKAESIISKMYWYLNYLKIHRYEKLYNNFNTCIVVNKKDKTLLEKDVHIPIEVIANGVDILYFKNNKTTNTPRLVFLGDMSTPPNNDAIKYFMEEIYPNITTEVDFYIVGRNPTEYIKNLQNRQIHVTGSVEDVRSYLPIGSIFVSPMISGTGIKNKILEAMSMQLPVITTSKGISGINAIEYKEFILADTPEKFKDDIMHLLENPEEMIKIGENARKLVEKKYSWQNSTKKIEEIIEKD